MSLKGRYSNSIQQFHSQSSTLFIHCFIPLPLSAADRPSFRSFDSCRVNSLQSNKLIVFHSSLSSSKSSIHNSLLSFQFIHSFVVCLVGLVFPLAEPLALLAPITRAAASQPTQTTKKFISLPFQPINKQNHWLRRKRASNQLVFVLMEWLGCLWLARFIHNWFH